MFPLSLLFIQALSDLYLRHSYFECKSDFTHIVEFHLICFRCSCSDLWIAFFSPDTAMISLSRAVEDLITGTSLPFCLVIARNLLGEDPICEMCGCLLLAISLTRTSGSVRSAAMLFRQVTLWLLLEPSLTKTAPWCLGCPMELLQRRDKLISDRNCCQSGWNSEVFKARRQSF